MGADIHMVLEVLHEGEWVGLHAFPYARVTAHRDAAAVWEYLSWLPRSRNYDLFAALAGVRGPGPEPRGMPEDASPLARMESDHWGGDGHSHSWMLMSEALPIFQRFQFNSAAARLGGMSLEELRTIDLEYFGMSDDEEEALDTYRLVFWFDN